MIVTYDRFLPDPGRTAAHVAVGVGFLGAGIIIKEKGTLSGIWTAVSLWIAAISGVAIGAQMFLEGATITFLAYFILSFPRE